MTYTVYDAAMVLGAGFTADGNLADTTKARLEKAASLHKNGEVRNLIVCGAHSYKAMNKPALSEAEAFAAYLQDLGVPKEALYLETDSQETLGNILFAKMRILIKHGWHTILVMPSYGHSSERINYLLQKILGPEYTWHMLRINENTEPANLAREAKSLAYTKEINDAFTNGDHKAIYAGLMKTHPAYGGTKWTIEELKEQLSSR